MSTPDQYAQVLLQHCLDDGAIVMGDPAVPSYSVTPYFANLAAQGLIDVYERTQNKDYFSAVENWLVWYMNHADPATGIIRDFTGTSSAGDIDWVAGATLPDSVDAYAATFITLACRVLPIIPSTSLRNLLATWVQKLLGLIGSMLITSGPADGLVTSKPSPYNVCDTEDNCEVLTALNSAAGARISIPTLDPVAQAGKTLAALKASFLIDQAPFLHFAVGIATDGTIRHASNLKNPYPDLQVQQLAIDQLYWQFQSVQTIYENLKTSFYNLPAEIADPTPDIELNNLDLVVWWGRAALRCGDMPTVKDIQSKLLAYDPGVGSWVHDIGHACMLLFLYGQSS